MTLTVQQLPVRRLTRTPAASERCLLRCRRTRVPSLRVHVLYLSQYHISPVFMI